MNKVIFEVSVGKYKLLTLDEKQSDVAYNIYQIDGKEYEPVLIYDAPSCVAIESNESFEGKTVKFLKKEKI